MPWPASCSVLNSEPGRNVLIVARGEPNVAWTHAGTERVIRRIEPAVVEVEADRPGTPLPELFLQIDRDSGRGTPPSSAVLELAAIAATSGTSCSRSPASARATSAVFAPGSYSSSSASYGSFS